MLYENISKYQIFLYVVYLEIIV